MHLVYDWYMNINDSFTLCVLSLCKSFVVIEVCLSKVIMENDSLLGIQVSSTSVWTSCSFYYRAKVTF